MSARTWVYGLGAYVAYPSLAAVGGLLLSRENSSGELALAAALLAAALVLPAFLGRYCRICEERLLPCLLRLLVMPAAVTTALAVRSPKRRDQYIAFALIGLSTIVFGLAWHLSARGAPMTGEEDDLSA